MIVVMGCLFDLNDIYPAQRDSTCPAYDEENISECSVRQEKEKGNFCSHCGKKLGATKRRLLPRLKELSDYDEDEETVYEIRFKYNENTVELYVYQVYEVLTHPCDIDIDKNYEKMFIIGREIDVEYAGRELKKIPVFDDEEIADQLEHIGFFDAKTFDLWIIE